MNDQRTTSSLDLSTPEPLPAAAIERALEMMRGGMLFRYGEDRAAENEAAALEVEFATYLGSRYCVAVNSGGSAIFIALKACGVGAGDKVLLNAFTLAPVPGAIHHAGGIPELVEIRDDLTIDLVDLEKKASESRAKVLLLSHMRGHISDMDEVVSICRRHDIRLIEDCAHSLAADWQGTASGLFGDVACFSSQTFKHLNSGEGGLLTTDSDEIAAQAILYSGSYMLYEQHIARPPAEVIERFRLQIPNCSMRMSGLAAALLRPQLPLLVQRRERWNACYRMLEDRLRGVAHLTLIERDSREGFVGSSLQFLLDGLNEQSINVFLDQCDEHGVHIKWFGRRQPVGFTSRYKTWEYIDQRPDLTCTDRVLDGLCDMRVPVMMSESQADAVAAVIRESVDVVRQTQAVT